MKFMILTQEGKIDPRTESIEYYPYSDQVIDGIGILGVLKKVDDWYHFNGPVDSIFYQRESSLIEQFGYTTLKKRDGGRHLKVFIIRMHKYD